MPSGRIADALEVPLSSLLLRLKVLYYAGLIKLEQVGRIVIYSATISTLGLCLSISLRIFATVNPADIQTYILITTHHEPNNLQRPRFMCG